MLVGMGASLGAQQASSVDSLEDFHEQGSSGLLTLVACCAESRLSICKSCRKDVHKVHFTMSPLRKGASFELSKCAHMR